MAVTPGGVLELVKRGHAVRVQTQAGTGSGFSDEDYVEAGASLAPTIESVYAEAEMIVKVKEPIEAEYGLLRDQLIFTYFHFASSEPLTHACIKSKAVCLAYKTVKVITAPCQLLIPMSGGGADVYSARSKILGKTHSRKRRIVRRCAGC